MIRKFINVLMVLFVVILFSNFKTPFSQDKSINSLSFTNITFKAGISNPEISATLGGHAAIFSDVDSDGFPDLYFTMLFDKPMADQFFYNIGDTTFVEEAVTRNISDFDGGSHGACFADLDNDGDFDLFNGTTYGNGEEQAINRIYQNDGSGFFSDVTNLSGIVSQDWPTRGVFAFDMENDGDLDLYCVTNYLGSEDPPQERNELYRNDGNMKFTAVKNNTLFTAMVGQGGTDTDYDNDGDIDLIIANRTGDLNIFNNNGEGDFTLVRPVSIGIFNRAGDGITAADIDNDADMDLMLVESLTGHLYLNNGNGTFTFQRTFTNISGYMGGFADLGNDSDLDLVFAGYDTCYLNDGNGNYSVGPSIPVDGIEDPRAIGFADIDNDGDLDFAIGCKRSHNYLIRNDLSNGNWLKIKLVSPCGQAGAFGAKIKVFAAYLEDHDEDNELVGFRESRSNNGYLGQDDSVLHFGLGPHDLVDVKVIFSDGSSALRKNISANQIITIDGNDGPQKYHLTVNNGSGDGNYLPGESVQIIATPQIIESSFIKWSGDINYLTDIHNENSILRMPANDISVTAEFQPTSFLWSPFLEWSVQNPTFEGNPFDVISTVTFTHTVSGEMRQTEMFYDQNDDWKFRFTGTKTGEWTYTTSSEDSNLNGLSGSLLIKSNPNPNIVGFMENYGNKWGRMGSEVAFIPQYVMYDTPKYYYNHPIKINDDINVFLDQHGFSGFHTMVNCAWFDLYHNSSDSIKFPNPDLKTFEALELLITKVHAKGGVVHIWAWGDEARRWTPVKWGKNGMEDQRLQRYIAARLGPLPGWSMGYGFDLDEWVEEEDLKQWHDYIQNHSGWKHFLGGRDPGPINANEPFNQIYESLDYSSYEQHRPDFNRYIETINSRKEKPSFSEDRFRIRGITEKDYSMEDVRLGLWRSAMAAGVANIWGNLVNPNLGELRIGNLTGSFPFLKPEWIKTYSLFFKNRFLKDLVVDNSLSDGYTLKHPGNSHYLFFKENSSSMILNLSEVNGRLPAKLIDAKLSYSEIDLGYLFPREQLWTAPYVSDWAIAVGEFKQDDIITTAENKQTVNNFILEQNYPNPFNSSTTLKFYTYKDETVAILIYNVKGQMVKEINFDSKSGFNNFIWDGKDQNNLDISSGVYIIWFLGKEFNSSKKMIRLN